MELYNAQSRNMYENRQTIRSGYQGWRNLTVLNKYLQAERYLVCLGEWKLACDLLL